MSIRQDTHTQVEEEINISKKWFRPRRVSNTLTLHSCVGRLPFTNWLLVGLVGHDGAGGGDLWMAALSCSAEGE
jgi:hypothetical protein